MRVMKPWIALALGFLPAIPAFAQAKPEPPVKVAFDVEGLKGPTAPKLFCAEVEKIAGIAECALSGNRATIALKPGARVSLADLRRAAEAVDQSAKIKDSTLKLEGRLFVEFEPGTDADRIKLGVLSTPNVLRCKPDGENRFFVEVQSPGGTTPGKIAHSIGSLAGLDAKAEAALIKNVVWWGRDPSEAAPPAEPPANEARPAPPPVPPPSAQPNPPPAPPKPPKPPGG